MSNNHSHIYREETEHRNNAIRFCYTARATFNTTAYYICIYMYISGYKSHAIEKCISRMIFIYSNPTTR